MRKIFYLGAIALLSFFINSFELFAESLPIICEKISKGEWEAGCKRDCPVAVQRGIFKDEKVCLKECISRFDKQCQDIKPPLKPIPNRK